MFKTLFSRMLVTYLAVTLGLLALLGVTVGAMFKNQYIVEKNNELLREAEEINTVLVTKYLDDDKRPVAKDELLTVARKYDALIIIRFDEAKLGKIVFIDEESADKWSGHEDVDLAPYYEGILRGGVQQNIETHVYDQVLDIPVMTLMRPITDPKSGAIGALSLNIDMSSINDSIRKVYQDVLLSAFVAVILAFLAVSYITNKITKPIAEMNNTVLRFSKGEFDARIPADGADEVSQLGSSFNIMADELNTLEQARRSFVANVSHELRSPLTSMRGFLEAMQDGTIPPEEHGKDLDIVVDENNRMIAMVNDLLDLARIESGQYTLHIEVFDVNELILRTLLTFEARISAKNIDVQLDFGEEKTYVQADSNQIAQVVRNLVDNAIKFSPEGGKLFVSTALGKKDVTVTVRDEGQGIPKDDVPFVFDRFYKAEKAHTPSGSSGTGLGLSIVKRIIDQHGQTITVESPEGMGACFAFTLLRSPEPQAKKNRNGAKPQPEHP